MSHRHRRIRGIGRPPLTAVAASAAATKWAKCAIYVPTRYIAIRGATISAQLSFLPLVHSLALASLRTSLHCSPFENSFYSSAPRPRGLHKRSPIREAAAASEAIRPFRSSSPGCPARWVSYAKAETHAHREAQPPSIPPYFISYSYPPCLKRN